MDYHQWRQRSVTVDGRQVLVASKPGLIGHGRENVAARLLAERVRVTPGATVVQMQCGNGLFGVIAALTHGDTTVHMTDRSVIGSSAAQRSVALNQLTNVTVHTGHGSAPLPPELRADVVAMCIPTEKLALLQLLSDAFQMLHIGGQCCIAGATNEGIKSAATLLKTLFGNATVLGTDSGHRVVMAVKRAPTPSDTLVLASPYLQHGSFHSISTELRGASVQLFSRPGVFSWEHVDEATALLAEVMEIRPGDDVLDIGCGIGALGLVAAQLSGTGRIRMVDVDSEAVLCAQRGVAAANAPNVTVAISDVADAVRDERFDVVVANPPFHVGKNTDLDVPAQFIAEAWQVLKPGGRLFLVANRTLPYERVVYERFGNRITPHDGPRFKVLSATRMA
jgi:16S rRNA (guanine1207-N2)-methyltransferase